MLKDNDGYSKAINQITKEKIPYRKIYAFVENGKPYKNTAWGFQQLEKDNVGFYLFANRGILHPEEFTISPWYGLAGGLIGSIIGGTITAINIDAQNKKAKTAEKHKVYIDPFMGIYSFDK